MQTNLKIAQNLYYSCLKFCSKVEEAKFFNYFLNIN